RVPVFSAAVYSVAARFDSQWVSEELALQAAGNHALLDDLEVLAGLRLVPDGASGRERLQAHGSARYMASDAAGVTWPLRQENRLYLGFEKLKIQLRRRGHRGRRVRGWRPNRTQ